MLDVFVDVVVFEMLFDYIMFINIYMLLVVILMIVLLWWFNLVCVISVECVVVMVICGFVEKLVCIDILLGMFVEVGNYVVLWLLC